MIANSVRTASTVELCAHAFMAKSECTVPIRAFSPPQVHTDCTHCFHRDGEYIDFKLILESSELLYKGLIVTRRPFCFAVGEVN